MKRHRETWRNIAGALLTALLITIISPGVTFSVDKNGKATLQEEYALKAQLLHRISRYVTWPKAPGSHDISKPFIISVIGENPFIIEKRGKKTDKNWLEIIYGGKKEKIKKRTVEIRFISDVKDIPGCDVLFISKSMRKQLGEILTIAEQHHVLTFGDTSGFAKKGVHINFYFKGGTIKFEINHSATLAAGFIVKFQLLKLAKIVDPPKKRG